MKISRSSFGQLGTRDVGLTTLSCDSLEVRVLDYGATVQALLVPDRQGRVEDVVLGFDRLEDYVSNTAFIGGIVGRVANRIVLGRFELGGREYQLDTNDAPHHLHGGHSGWDKMVWAYEGASVSERGDSASVLLSHDSPDGEGHYPGHIRAQVEFKLTRTALEITMSGTTDRPTLLNLAHHGYFNLGGPSRAHILDHELVLHSDERTPGVVPDGTLTPVGDTPFDFCTKKPIGRDLPERDGAPPGYDDNFVVRRTKEALFAVAELSDPASGRTMHVSANQPGVQLYSGNFLDGSLSGKGRRFTRHAAVCLETQAFPNAVNVSKWREQVLLEPGQTYRHVQVFRFS
ncbi:MAG TPA: aldose epimerase family protein [Polyangiaceae bacterium]|nr:aldose epimerase family protein [Polyangiaceae bacterium]